jgi:uncharacterized membrane protein YczE
VKWAVDSSLVALALMLALPVFGKPVGVREGTLVAACMIGPVIHVLTGFFAASFRISDKPHF